MRQYNEAHNSSGEESIGHKDCLVNAANEFASETTDMMEKFDQGKCPLDVLPDGLTRLIQELAEKYKFPVDFSLMYLFFAFSLAIGNRFRIRIKKDWIEPAILYMAVVALAGQTKTPVQTFFMSKFKEWDKASHERFIELMTAFEQAKQVANKNEPFTAERPRRKQSLLQDYTPEALVKVLTDNWSGVGVMMDELAGFFGNMNRYNNGNEVPMWLSFYNAQPYSSNRKTTQDAYVAHPFVSVIGGIQPGILTKTFSGDMKINGMIDRFLFAYPTCVKKEVPTELEVDPFLTESYTNAIQFILEIEPMVSDKDGKNMPRLMDLTPSAKTLLFRYFQANADKVNDLNDAGYERQAGMYSKYDYHVIRLSFILQVMHDACNGSRPYRVSEEAVMGGIRLADYFKIHSDRVHGLISGDALAMYNEDKRLLYEQLPDGEFTFAEAISLGSSIRQTEINKGTLTEAGAEKWVQRFLAIKRLFNQPKTGCYKKNLTNQ